MKRHALAFALSLILISSVVFAVATYIRPPFIVINQHVKNGLINIIEGKVELANKFNPFPVRVHLGSAAFVEFDDNDFILQQGQFRNITFYVVVTRWGGYNTFIDATYSAPGEFSATVSADLDVNAFSNGTGTNSEPPTAPVIIEPQSGTIINGPLNLKWTASSDADPGNNILYYVIVDDDQDFSSPIVNASTVKLNKSIQVQPGYIYYWKVIAYDGKFYTSSVSGSGMTENKLPGIPNLTSPANGVTLNSEPLLSWSAVVDPDGTPVRYDLLVDNNADFSSPEINVVRTSSTNYSTKGKLNEGTYYWKVRSKDNIGSAGYSAVRSFTLDCVDVYCYNIEVNSPQSDTYNGKKTLVDLSISRNAKYIYKALNSRIFTKICSDCLSVSKSYMAKEGLNNLTIRIVGYNGEELIQSVFFTVDTIKPRISKTEPRDKSTIGGTSFRVKYTERNLQGISLFYGNGAMNEAVLSNCPSGSNVQCSIDLDLSAYNGQSILYYFIVRDEFRSVASKTYNLTVDTSPPVLNLLAPANGGIYDNRAKITVSVNEKSKLQYSDNGGSFRSLCLSCNFYNKTKYFKDGFHNLVVRATDKAGNADEKSVSFTIV